MDVVRGIAVAAASVLLGFSFENSEVPRDEIQSGGPPKDGIPALLAPEFVEADNAPHVSPDDLVVGVATGDEARAYPIRILNWHEVVNDAIGDRAVAVTWCPLTASAVVFDRRLAGEGAPPTTFGVSGLLYQSNVLVYDHETETLWSQLGERGIAGDLAGRRLSVLPSLLTTWSTWRRTHPETKVLSSSTGHRRDYTRDPYGDYHASTGVLFAPKHHDPRLPGKAKVFGTTIGDEAVAYPLTALATRPSFTDSVGGRTIRVAHDPSTGSTRITDAASGELLPATPAYWFAWSAFHPTTRLGPEEPAPKPSAASR